MGRLFLILLLACDWAADPSQGTSPLSRRFASTETFCHSLAYREQICKESSPTPRLDSPRRPSHVGTPRPPLISPTREMPALLSPDGIVYIFMSLRR